MGSPIAGIVYVGVDSAGCGVVTGTRNRRLPSISAALSWCDELGLQVLNRDEVQHLADHVTILPLQQETP